MKNTVFCAVVLSCIASTAWGAFPFSFACNPTPEVVPEVSRPEKITKSNTLLRKTGQVQQSLGEPIIVIGQVVDVNCVPVQNAVVSMWQTDSAGRYQSEYSPVQKISTRAGYDPFFAYSGQARSDNQGEFVFFSIFPGISGAGYAPHLAMNIYHPKYDDLTTRMYFPYMLPAKEDMAINVLTETERDSIISWHSAAGQGGKVFYFRIVLDGADPYRGL